MTLVAFDYLRSHHHGGHSAARVFRVTGCASYETVGQKSAYRHNA